MKRAQLVAGQMVAHERYGVALPALVVDTQPWHSGYSGRMSPTSGGSGVAVAMQRGWENGLPHIVPEVVQLQTLVRTWDQQLEREAAEKARQEEAERSRDTEDALIKRLPASLQARTVSESHSYKRKLGRVDVDLRELVDLILSYHAVSYEA